MPNKEELDIVYSNLCKREYLWMNLVDDNRKMFTKVVVYDIKAIFTDIVEADMYILIHDDTVKIDAVCKTSNHAISTVNVSKYTGDPNPTSFTKFVVSQVGGNRFNT